MRAGVLWIMREGRIMFFQVKSCFSKQSHEVLYGLIACLVSSNITSGAHGALHPSILKGSS